MESRTELSMAELYALERAARLARAREVARLIRAGVDALIRFVSHAVSMPGNGKGINHA